MKNIIEISSFMDDFLIPKQKHLTRIGILPVESVISTLKEIYSIPCSSRAAPYLSVFGKSIDTFSVKLKTFVDHGTVCKCCGIHAIFFAVEFEKTDKKKSIILNLYSIDDNGEEVLMNADHRLPKFRGGSNGVDNMQTMCQPCNLRKGCKLLFTEGGISKQEAIKKNS